MQSNRPGQIISAHLRLNVVRNMAKDRITADTELFGERVKRCPANAKHLNAMALKMLANRARGQMPLLPHFHLSEKWLAGKPSFTPTPRPPLLETRRGGAFQVV